MHKVLHIVGARPQFIKAAMVSRAMRKLGRFREIIVHTGQHFDESMSGIFFKELELPRPQVNLGVDSLAHGAMTGRMLEKCEKVIAEESPEWVVVYGDTNSTLAGALAAAKMPCKLAHVEAGLRSHNMRMPEEINRIMTDRISDYLFCPTETSVKNLEREGVSGPAQKVIRSGDVMLDAALFYGASAEEQGRLRQVLPEDFILCTVHRESNANDPVRLRSIVHALNRIHKNHPVVWPVHPRTRKAIAQAGIQFDGITLDPVGYLEMLAMLKRCRLVATDSGGLQKEAYFFHKGCVTLREETEWTELVALGCNRLVGADEEKIFMAVQDLLKGEVTFSGSLFGDGKAAEIIGKSLLDYNF